MKKHQINQNVYFLNTLTISIPGRQNIYRLFIVVNLYTDEDQYGIQNVSMLHASISRHRHTFFQIHVKIYFNVVTLSIHLFIIESEGKTHQSDIFLA